MTADTDDWMREQLRPTEIAEPDQPSAEPPAPPAGRVPAGPRGDHADGYVGDDWMREKLNGRSLLAP